MIFNVKVLLTIVSAIGLAAAQAQCNNDNDCPGSEVCCSANVGFFLRAINFLLSLIFFVG
jgi:hypothetical protein